MKKLTYLVPLKLTALAVFTTPGFAFADTQAVSEIERIVTTATRSKVNADELPLVVSSIRNSDLRLNAHTHIQESLAQIAGVNLHRGNGQEYLPALRSPVFTGAGACGEILTTEDGIPIRASGFCNINELFEAHSEMAQRIEVLKGPGSVFHGANAIHGVINVITPDTTVGGGRTSFEAGSFGYTRYGLQAGKNKGNSGFGISTSVTRDTGYRDDESVDQEKVTLRYRFEGDNWQTMTGLSYANLDQETAGFITGFEAYKDADIAQSNANPEAFRKNRALRLWSRTQWQPSDDSLFTITPYVRDQSMDFLQHFLPGTPLEQNAQRGIGLQSDWSLKFDRQWQLRIGLDAEYTQGELQQSQAEPTQGSAFLVETIPTGRHYDYDVSATQVSPFLQMEWQHAQWSVNLGARYEQIRYDYTNNMLDGRTREDGTLCGFGGCRYSRPPSGKNQFNHFSPKLGVRYSMNNTSWFYANLARGYRAPQATELYRLQRAQVVADLDAVTVNNAEIGYQHAATNLRYLVSAYWMKKSNVIFRDSDFFNVSDGKTQHKGIELELEYQFLPNWKSMIAYTHARHTYENDRIVNSININGNLIDTAPRNFANLRLAYTPVESVQLALEWQAMGSYFTDPENQNDYDGHSLFNLRGSWQISEGFAILARIINLTDEAYAERADFTGFSGDRYFPGRPRSYFLGLTYNW